MINYITDQKKSGKIMAVFKNKALGTLSGRIGDNVMKNYSGRVVIAKRPGSNKKSSSKVCQGNRSTFGMKSIFACAAAHNPVLKQIWKRALNTQQRVHCSIISLNKGIITPETGYSNALLVPFEPDLEVKLLETRMENDIHDRHFFLKISPFVEGIYGQSLSFQGVLCASGCTEKNEKPTSFVPVASNELPVSFESEMEFKIALPKGEVKLGLDKYPQFTLYLIAVTKNEIGEPLKLSSTKEISFN
jgi:hypothetical protein